MYNSTTLKSIRNLPAIAANLRTSESESPLLPDRTAEFRAAGHSCLTCNHFVTGRMIAFPLCNIKPGKTKGSKKPVRAYNICGKWTPKT
jgi:hypothetical protein